MNSISRGRGQPADFDFLLHRPELRVAGNEFGVLLLGQSDGEGGSNGRAVLLRSPNIWAERQLSPTEDGSAS